MKTLIGERIDGICDKLNLSKADFTRRIGLESNATISRIASGKVCRSHVRSLQDNVKRSVNFL